MFGPLKRFCAFLRSLRAPRRDLTDRERDWLRLKLRVHSLRTTLGTRYTITLRPEGDTPPAPHEDATLHVTAPADFDPNGFPWERVRQLCSGVAAFLIIPHPWGGNQVGVLNQEAVDFIHRMNERAYRELVSRQGGGGAEPRNPVPSAGGGGVPAQGDGRHPDVPA